MKNIIIYIALVLFTTQCAQIASLSGGKKDVTAPKPLLFNPSNASVNFTSKTIEIVFDEYIVLKDVANQFIITPQTKEIPNIQVMGKKLKISFTESLLPNTTYKLAFGNAIVDINEGNILQNFEYVFSTGSVIDSLSMKGVVLSAFDKKPSEQALVGLYNASSNDSIIYKQKPLYIAKTNQNGQFVFSYLPNNNFKIIAIKDNNKNLLYDGDDEQLAFSSNLINPSDSLQPTLLLFKEIPEKTFIKKNYCTQYGKAFVIYNKPQMNITDVKATGLITYQLNKTNDTLVLYYINKYDTLNPIIKYSNKKSDTLAINLPSQELVKKQNDNTFIANASARTFLHYYSLPVFELNQVINSENIIDTKINLTEKKDSVIKNIPIKIVKNSEWITSFKVQADFIPETNYTLTIHKGAIMDDSKRLNDSVSYSFKTTSIEDYAQLNMKLFFPKKEKYIVQLLNDNMQVVEERFIEFSLTSTSEKNEKYINLIPGNYFIKVIEDANENKRFDTGNYFNKQQAETIFLNSFPIKLLAGWEIENEWIVK